MDGPVQRDSVYKIDYNEKPIQKTQNFSPSKDYSPSRNKFEERTTNQIDYDEKPIHKAQNFSPSKEYSPSKVRFEETTTNQIDYEPKPLPEKIASRKN